MQVNCSEYRKFMELLALRSRVEKSEEEDPEERQRILRRIRELEMDLKVV